MLAERQPCTAGGNSSTQGRLGAPESTCAAHEIAITPEDKERQEEAEDKEEGGRRKEGDEKEGGKSWVGEEGKGPGGRLPTRRSPCPAELQLLRKGEQHVYFQNEDNDRPNGRMDLIQQDREQPQLSALAANLKGLRRLCCSTQGPLLRTAEKWRGCRYLCNQLNAQPGLQRPIWASGIDGRQRDTTHVVAPVRY